MSKEVWKYPLSITRNQDIILPSDYKILSIQVQSGRPMMWALVDPDARETKINLKTFGTGHPIDGSVIYRLTYIDTYQFVDGTVWHVFESK